MRVISGSLKGYKLFAPRSKVRPTSDRVKEAMFNLIPDMEGKNVLDLFCGSGSLGIEALSRGAELAVFVDQSHAAISFTKKNISNTDLEARSLVYQAQVKKFLKKYKRNIFGVIFLDPPYNISPLEIYEIFNIIIDNQLINRLSVVVYEHSSRVSFKENERYEVFKVKSYGDTALTLLMMKDAIESYLSREL